MSDSPIDLRAQAAKSRRLAQIAFKPSDKAQFEKLADEFEQRAAAHEREDPAPEPVAPIKERSSWPLWLGAFVVLVFVIVMLVAFLAIVGWIIGFVLAIIASGYVWLRGARKDG